MSIKRISRRRVAASVTEYVDEEPLATRIDTKEDSRVSAPVNVTVGGPDDARVGGDVETKAIPAVASRVGGDVQSRVGTNVDTRTGTDVAWTYSNKEGRAEPAGGRASPTKSRW